MRIDIKEIQELLTNCNVNFYDMYIDNEMDCIDIDINESIENVEMDDLIEGLKRIVSDDVEVVGDGTTISCSIYFEDLF